MPDQLSHEFEHEVLEADIKKLAGEVLRHREAPENQALTDQEVLKQSIQSLNSAPEEISQKSSESPLPDYAVGASSETKLEIEYLLDIAFHKGIEAANSAARNASPFVRDAFHDSLVGKLYPELKRRGILK